MQVQYPGRLYVAIPEFRFSISLPSDIPLANTKATLDKALKELINLGMSPKAPVFLVGHSIGGFYINLTQGWAVQGCANQYPDQYQGLILLGAAIERNNELTMAVDILTIVGEYDRPMRAAEARMKSLPGNPIVVLSGLGHIAYTNYSALPFNVMNDIQPKVCIFVTIGYR
jgi:triacylglycerol esterase/lipase EstA (alpha/beta hydrolase family)